MTSVFSDKLLTWYQQNKRLLPWRDNPQPYLVWISEIMLQQTKVETAIPYFQRWIDRFPDIATLAEANQSEVLQVWEGLGYYARARNLHQAAKVIMERFNGQLPENPTKLRSLPGIGEYTANAIASIAFHQNYPALDSNISRVIARLIALDLPVSDKNAKQQIHEFVWVQLPNGKADQFNQALMELGALICTPRKPNCNQCPLISECQANQQNRQNQIPRRIPKKSLPHLTVTAGVIWQDRRVLIAQRPQNGLLGGLWEFPGGKLEKDESLHSCLLRELNEELNLPVNIEKKIGVYYHAYTHFKITLHAFCCYPVSRSSPLPLNHQALYWAELNELAHFPMGKIDRQIAHTISKESICLS